MAIAAGSYVRFALSPSPPPGQEVNANSPMLITKVTQDPTRGGMVTCTRQGQLIGTYPASSLVEVRAP